MRNIELCIAASLCVFSLCLGARNRLCIHVMSCALLWNCISNAKHCSVTYVVTLFFICVKIEMQLHVISSLIVATAIWRPGQKTKPVNSAGFLLSKQL